MSVRVSYKKQFLLGILILLTILVVVEGIARTYEFFDPKCGLVGKDVFENTDPLTVRQICYDFQILQYDQQTIIMYEPNQHYPTTNIFVSFNFIISPSSFSLTKFLKTISGFSIFKFLYTTKGVL